MKLRAGVSALFLTFVVPAALTEAGLSNLPLTEPLAAAQAADAVTEVARQRYEEGVKAYDAGRYEDARAAFLQVYALKRHPAVLLNLGQSELRSGHNEDAGNHLQQFLREHKGATPDQRVAAEKGVADAKKKTGFIIVIVDANGADVSVDGALVGKSPLLDPVFVKPGKHTLFATYQGKSSTTQVDAKIGSAAAATLTLGVAGAPAPAPVPAPAPAPPSPSPSPPPVAPSAPAAPSPMGPVASAQPSPGAPPASEPGSFNFSTSGGMGSMGPDQPTGKREPFFDWYTRKPIAWAGTGVAGLGLIGGIIFSGLAASSSGSADDIAAAIRKQATDYPETVPPGRDADQVCGPREDPSGDLAGYETACNALRDKLDAYDTQYTVATVGWVLFGVGVVGTGAYALVDWYLYPDKKASAEGLRLTAVAPVIAPGHAGLGVAGTF